MDFHRSFNVLGSIALVNFSDKTKLSDKKKFAQQILKKHKNIKTVLEKSENFKGRLRKMQTKHLAGIKNKEVLYKENNCVFRFNIDTTYFSPRLSNERKEISEMIKGKNKEVFVMFAGVAPFSIVIAKNSKNVENVYSNELNKVANVYGKLNAERNKVKDKIEFVDGDIKRVAEKLKQKRKKFDYIIMPRPNLKDNFLKEAFMLSKKSTRIIYYGFSKLDEVKYLIEDIKKNAKQNKKKVKINKIKPAGEIAPYKIRVRVDFSIL